MSNPSVKQNRPLPVEGMEYWGVEARVRFLQLKNWCSEYEIDVSVGIGTWNGILSGSLHFHTYDNDTAETYLRGKANLCVGDYDIDKNRADCYYLRVNRIAGDLSEHPRVLPGSSMRPAHASDDAAARHTPGMPAAAPAAAPADDTGFFTPDVTAMTTMTDPGVSGCDGGFSGGGFSDGGGGMGCS